MGMTALEAMETLPRRLFRMAVSQPEAPAYRFRVDGQWVTMSWSEVVESVERMAAGLIALGVEPGDRVIIWGKNSHRWVLADLAILSAGAVTVPIDASSTASQAAYIFVETRAKVAFVTTSQCQAASTGWADRPRDLESLIMLSGRFEGSIADQPVQVWDDLDALADESRRLEVKKRLERLAPVHLATIIFTSGTSGQPKGVMLDHGLIFSVAESIGKAYDARFGDVVLCYLPLNHAIERLISAFLPILARATVCFSEYVEQMPADLRETRPTVFLGVPRIWEKFSEAICGKVTGMPMTHRLLFETARVIEARMAACHDQGRRPGLLLGLLGQAGARWVAEPLKRALGLDRCRYLLSGGAPLRPDTLLFLRSIGLRVLEDYGQTETIVTTVSTDRAWRSGTVGRPLPGTRLRLAVDGEIEVKSQRMFLGYWNNDRETRESFTVDGWFKTGDLGQEDAGGFVTITGRKKALMIISGGKNVAPEPLEAELSAIPGVSQAVVFGDGRKYLVALLAIDEAMARRLSSDPRADIASPEDLAADPSVFRALEAGIKAVNRSRAPFEQIKTFSILPHPFTVEGGELTPLQKIRREIVEHRHAGRIASLYTSTTTPKADLRSRAGSIWIEPVEAT